MRRCGVGRLSLIAVGLLVGCASVPPLPESVPRVADGTAAIAPWEAEAAAGLGTASARHIQTHLPGWRAHLDEALVWEEIACYRRFLSHRCVTQVQAQRRRVESRLTHLEATAAQTLRHEAAIARAAAEAKRLAAERAAEAADAAQRTESRLAYERKVQAAAQAEARRQADARARAATAPRAKRPGSQRPAPGRGPL